MSGEYNATPAHRRTAVKLAEAKLSGDKLVKARGFIYKSRRSKKELDAFMMRLDTLPDLDDAANKVPQSRVLLNAGEQADIIHLKEVDGLTIREIAERYEVSYSTIYRTLHPEERERDRHRPR